MEKAGSSLVLGIDFSVVPGFCESGLVTHASLPRRGWIRQPGVASGASAPWVGGYDPSPTPRGLHKPSSVRITFAVEPLRCGTLAGFDSGIDTYSQGGAAAPLTLGFRMQPLRGKDLRHSSTFLDRPFAVGRVRLRNRCIEHQRPFPEHRHHGSRSDPRTELDVGVITESDQVPTTEARTEGG